MLSVVMLNVVMLSVIVPLSGAPTGQKKFEKRSSLFSRRGGNEEKKFHDNETRTRTVASEIIISRLLEKRNLEILFSSFYTPLVYPDIREKPTVTSCLALPFVDLSFSHLPLFA
jgi:hypothetical protein